MTTRTSPLGPLAASLITLGLPLPAAAEEPETTELQAVEVVGITPVHGVGLPKEKIPANIQTATDEDIDRGESLDLTQFMDRNLGNVTVNAAQNNPLQPDLNYRGFSASPLLGLPQGLTVFVNGVRYNDPFGDTVNWDLLPESMVKSMNVVGGANPLFGLNTLGGAISVQTKNGFNAPGHRLEVYGGSFGRTVVSAESGANDGNLGYFINVRNFAEDGWRDASPSDALNLYSSFGWHDDATTLDFNVLYGSSDLTGNGAVPVELLRQDRNAVFTSPDRTENDMVFLTLEGTHWLNDKIQFAGNAFFRDTTTHSFNGDDSAYVDCSEAGKLFRPGLTGMPAYPLFPNNDAFWGFLAANGIHREDDEPGECPEEIEELAGSKALVSQVIRDQYGNPVGYNDPDRPLNAINNRSHRDQQSFGTTGQATFLYDLFGFKNQFIMGFAYNRGLVNFSSSVETVRLNADRSTGRTGIFIPEDATGLSGSTTTWSGFFNDALDLTETVTLTVGGRFNQTVTNLGDTLGNAPELVGSHDFRRFNPSVGLTWQATDWANLYGGYSESARAPTLVELACSDPDADCRLPNAFLADPPLKQVVAKSFEAGARGSFDKVLRWNVGFFNTLNRNDILFQSTGGATSNIGYFANVGDTRRLGVEAGFSGIFLDGWQWYLNYGFVDATFQRDFTVSSPNHPDRVETIGPDNEYNALIQVKKGNRIPGIPQHNLKAGLEVPVTDALTLGAQGIFNSGQYLRGDESNALGQTASWFVLNLYGSYRFNEHVTAFATLQNVTDEKYETFGILGESNELPGFQNFSNPRFLGPAPPFGGWVGLRLSL